MDYFSTKISQAKEKLAALFREFTASKPEDLPLKALYRELDTEELLYLVKGATDARMNDNYDVAAAAAKLGWLDEDRGGPTGTSYQFLKLLEKEGLLLHFYAMLLHMKANPLA
jgi:hypothetical protein